MKVIELTQGQVALVSDHRFEELNQFKWHAWWSEETQSFYARRNIKRPDGKRRQISMHRQIMGDPAGKIVDHINHHTLDNQDHNLRAVGHAESVWNTKVRSNNKLGERNIYVHPYSGRYVVSIRSVKYGFRFAQEFYDLEEAKQIRDQKLIELFGQYAYGVSV
jgi:hypothetical protein